MKKDIDRYAHCINCHRNLLRIQVVDQREQVLLSPEHNEELFQLNDGSQMRVCLCLSCKPTLNLNDSKIHEEIMNKVFEGWKAEVELLVNDPKKEKWTKESGLAYLNEYKKKAILGHSDAISIEQRKEIIAKQVESIKEEIEVKNLEKVNDPNS